jgi:hypothetical protein
VSYSALLNVRAKAGDYKRAEQWHDKRGQRHELLPRTGVGTLPCATALNWGGHPSVSSSLELGWAPFVDQRTTLLSAGTLTCTTLLSALVLVRETQEEMRSGFTRGGKQMLPSFGWLLTSSPTVPS